MDAETVTTEFTTEYRSGWKRVSARIWKATGGGWSVAATSALLGTLLVFWLHLLIMAWGMTSFAGVSLATAGCLVLLDPLRNVPARLRALSFAGTAVTTLATPLWWGSWDRLLTTAVQFEPGGVWLAAMLHGVFLGYMAVCAIGLFDTVCRSTNLSRSAATAIGWGGFAFGLWIVAAGFSTLFPIYWLAAVASVALSAGSLLVFVWRNNSSQTRFETRNESNSQPESTPLSGLLLAGLAGAIVTTMLRITSQLQAETTLFVYGCLTAMCVGLALSAVLSKRVPILAWVAILAGVTAAFPLWMRASLSISALVSSTTAAVLLRQMILLAFFVPVGALFGQIWRSSTQPADMLNSQGFFSLARLPMTVCAVGVVGAWLGVVSSGWVPTSVLLVCCLTGMLLVLAGEALWRKNANWALQSKTQRRITIATVAIAVVTGGLIPRGYQPELTARVLFSTQMFQAWRQGTKMDQLIGLDDGRHLGTRRSLNGTFTFWRHQGSHVQVRKNGIPVGRISNEARLVPQPTGGLLSAVLPLSLHPAAKDVLVLGLDSGLSLKTVLEFPVMRVDCVEADSVLINEARDGLLAEPLSEIWDDDRLTVTVADPNIQLRRDLQTYDLILETPGHSAVYRHAGQFDEGHYQRIAARLSDHGMYCQRFTFSDYGPAVLGSLTETLNDVFGYVTAFDTAPGEMLFVAARSQDDVLTEGLISRLSAPQVRRCLARTGWDWSVAMNLARFEATHLADVRSYGPLDAVSGLGPFRLATEMMRWDNKWGEVRAVLTNNPTRLLEHYQDEKQIDDILRRLSDVAARERSLVKYPDQFWMYRKSLKKRLLDNPRSVIVPVKGEGLKKQIHPEDSRRLEYFETLGQAAQQNPCDFDLLAELESYTTPYDPMVSYFLHSEIARLYQRTPTPARELELQHSLHTLYFGSMQERSVRAIHRCLELLADDATQLTSEQRYDQTNTLLELLRIRWQMRRGRRDIAKPVLLIDLKQSLEAADRGLATLRIHGSAIGIPNSQLETRIATLEKSLVVLLKSERIGVLARATRQNYPLSDAEKAEPARP